MTTHGWLQAHRQPVAITPVPHALVRKSPICEQASYSAKGAQMGREIIAAVAVLQRRARVDGYRTEGSLWLVRGHDSWIMIGRRYRCAVRSGKWEGRKRGRSYCPLLCLQAAAERTDRSCSIGNTDRRTQSWTADASEVPAEGRPSAGAIVSRQLSRQRLPFAALMIQACLLQLAGAQLSELILCPYDHVSELCNGGIDPQ